jgi:hypothetical protein
MKPLRPPEPNETPLSAEELAFALHKRLIAQPNGFDPDEVDIMPVKRIIRPAGTWGIKTQGLRHADPFDWLVR